MNVSNHQKNNSVTNASKQIKFIISFPNFIKMSHVSTRAKLQVLPETLDIYISFCFRFVISMVPKFFGTITDTDIRRLFRFLFF